MFFKLVALFIGVPLLEIAILVRIGTIVGFWPTMFLVVATGIVGAALAQFQGYLVWARIQNELRAGRMPAEQLIDGLLIFIGGLVLLTPGLLTDILGFAMLVPASRNWFKRWLRRKFESMVNRREARVEYFWHDSP